ncbi:MAG: SusE domain-containing protein [Prevotellaceae bacterium]|jgi:hypothetical protein|nr:SusE domain-containing protein [Prevotellaceae bacterium]
MKKVKYLYKTLPLLFAILCLNACIYEIQDIDKVKEHIELTASATDIALDENNLTTGMLTFTWTEARQMSSEYIVSYTTKLDIVGNNFGTSTVILNYEDEGVFSRSFTFEQLHNWANDKWKLPINRVFTLEFRVTAEWEGGPTFETPEVRTVTVDVQPIKVVVFDADKMFIAGNAVPGSKIEINKTLENASQYAWFGNLNPGELQIPVELEGMTYYIIPEDEDGSTLQDGIAENVKMEENPVSWNIATAGEYRIVINMEAKVVTIYSSATALQPAVVNWTHPINGAQQTTVTQLWRYKAWEWVTDSNQYFSQSLADPQIFVYSGPAFSGTTKFGVAAHNNSYVYTNGNNGATVVAALNTVYTLYGGNGGSGAGTNERNSYINFTPATNFIVINIRNMTFSAESH